MMTLLELSNTFPSLQVRYLSVETYNFAAMYRVASVKISRQTRTLGTVLRVSDSRHRPSVRVPNKPTDPAITAKPYFVTWCVGVTSSETLAEMGHDGGLGELGNRYCGGSPASLCGGPPRHEQGIQ